MPLCTFGPPAERKRYWILKFEDRDVGDMHFTVEPDAMRAWDRYKDSYTCTLFVTAEFVDADRQALLRLRGGGPTIAEPERPYCKPDQSCCNFCCGN